MPFVTLLDDFNTGASQNLVAATRTGWAATVIYSGSSPLQTDGVPTYAGAAGNTSSAWGALLSADQEAWAMFQQATVHDCNVYCRLTGVGTASVNGYTAQLSSGTGLWTISKVIATVGSTLTSGVSQAISGGDGVCLVCVGTTLTSFYKAPGGGVTQLETVTDASITGAGQIGLDGYNTDVHFDSFGGGSLVTSSLAGINFERQGDRRN